ncbi:His Kinase A domain containing protein [Tulasnella sp. 417]|nr:His Kinase A domain containing protein [Tulasnella sp. 417]
MRAYAEGLWDPFKIPHPPQKSPVPTAARPLPSNANASLRRASTATPFPPPQSGSTQPLGSSATFSVQPTVRTPSGPPTPSIAQRRGAEAPDLRASPNVNLVSATPPVKGATAFPLRLPQMPGRPTFRSSGSDPMPLADDESEEFPPAPSVDSITAAATVRWAGAGVDVAPLALPSPEYELTDPFRRMNPDAPRTPRSPGPRAVDARNYRSPRRDHRSPQAVRSGITSSSIVKSGYESDPLSNTTRPYGSRPMTPSLEVIKGSPVGSPNENPESEAELSGSYQDGATHIMSPGVQQERSSKSGGDYFHRASPLHNGTTRTPGGTLVAYMAFPGLQALPGASSVPTHAVNSVNDDYSGNVKGLSSPETKEAPEPDRLFSSGLLNTGLVPRTPGGRWQTIEAQLLPGMIQELSATVPDGASHLLYSDPHAKQDAAYVLAAAGAMHPPPGTVNHTGLFEAWYATAGYLIPPMPPNETERRKALYRYNILDSAKDPNFDRIVHLAKLVFNTKGVLISFTADSRQWNKAHTILQRSSEPVIVPDALKDWRFANNPCVIGGPKVRFYAGAPLRTPDGYNIGTLCIFDPEPKPETSARTRHALKEFATIVMREMELWKDKVTEDIQLGIRDRIQNSMERFTRECLETDVSEDPKAAAVDMAKVYQKAATLVRNTLDVCGCVIMDLSHFEAVDIVDSSGKKTTLYIGNAYEGSPTSGSPPVHASAIQRKTEFGPIAPLPVHAADEDEDESNAARDEPISSEDHAVLSKFLATCPEGRIYERLPKCFKRFVPSNLQYTMMVPVFDVDKRPIFMLCAYTRKGIMHVMEGYELQYLRAVGVIILSVVLKHRMTVANTAKTNFISNISHELRTPLHGIVAAADLLKGTRLTYTQDDYLKTVMESAEELSETVNHVLDFTKLSGKTNESAPRYSVQPVKFDLALLIDETVETCWIGSRARAEAAAESIGSYYCPPNRSQSPETFQNQKRKTPQLVEIMSDIDLCEKGWWIKSDKAGIRRILMNLISNSIKFTKDGFICVRLEQVTMEPSVDGKVTIKITVTDTGKGIGKDFQQNRMWEAFSQEDPLQSGTGLGLSIVNQIARALGGKPSVRSEEGQGTSISVFLQVDAIGDVPPTPIVQPAQTISVTMLGFNTAHRGVAALKEILTGYLVDWWGFRVTPEEEDELGDILFINEDFSMVSDLTAARDFGRPVVFMHSSRGDSEVMATVGAFERLGGWCRLVFKPKGPTKLEEAFRTAVSKMEGVRESPSSSASHRSLSFLTAQEGSESDRDSVYSTPISPRDSPKGSWQHLGGTPVTLTRRRSEEHRDLTPRPPLGQRSSTYTGTSLKNEYLPDTPTPPATGRSDSATASPAESSTVEITPNGSVMLRSLVGKADPDWKPVVLLVDDNHVNRKVLSSWLNKKVGSDVWVMPCMIDIPLKQQYEWRQATDGLEAVEVFKEHPPNFFNGARPSPS